MSSAYHEFNKPWLARAMQPGGNGSATAVQACGPRDRQPWMS